MKETKIKRKTYPKQVYAYLLEKKVACTKSQICGDLSLRLTTVNRACGILRKEKKIGMYYRKYWGKK